MTAKLNKKRKGWHVGLWIAQILLAGMFLMAGSMKTFLPTPDLIKVFPLAGEMLVLIRFIGISELAGGLGLLLPAALRIKPQLTVLAAGGLTIVMVLAFAFHASRGEWTAIGTNIVLASLAAFIAWGRTTKAPIAERVTGQQAVLKT